VTWEHEIGDHEVEGLSLVSDETEFGELEVLPSRSRDGQDAGRGIEFLSIFPRALLQDRIPGIEPYPPYVFTTRSGQGPYQSLASHTSYCQILTY